MNIAKSMFVVLCIFSLGCSYSMWNAKEEKSYNVNDAFKSVVKIGMDVVDEDGSIGTVSGTAWAIDRDHLITASHVCMAFVEIGNEIDITYFDPNFELRKKTIDAEIVFSDAVNDVCLIRYLGHGLVPLKLADNVKFGEKVYIVGAPFGLLGFVFDGRVVNFDFNLSPAMKDKIIVSAASTSGNSGGPVLNESGEVIGILIAGSRTFDHFSICTSLDVLKTVIKLLN